MQNSDLWTRITSLYGSQTSPVALCMQNSDFRTRNTSLCGSQTSLGDFASKTATLGQDLQVCMWPRPYVWYWVLITAWLEQEYQVCIGSSHHLWFCACKTATLGLELQVSVGGSHHLWFLHEKPSLSDQNYKSLWVADLTCRFVLVKRCD